MGKDNESKEDSGFGFKDKEKAVETLKLLEKEPASYQSLTVRGLLGRAKRTLKLTKDEVKLKNISEAIGVFEKWIEDNKKPGGSTTDKKSSSNKKSQNNEETGEKKEKDDNAADTVSGLGFKDKEKAVETIKLLEGRDPDYQKLAVKGLVGRAKRVLTCTKDKEKLQNIKNALNVFEKFLDDFDKMNMSKQNMSYLPLSVIDSCYCLVEYHKVMSSKTDAFIQAYRSVDGQYKKLRTVEDEKTKLTWDIIRNKELKILRKELDDPDLFEDEGNPTKEHLRMILWAFSPQEHRMKKIKIMPPNDDTDMKESFNGDKTGKGKDKKRKHSTSSDDDETPEKKRK